MPMAPNRPMGPRTKNSSSQTNFDVSLKAHHIPLLGILLWIFHPQEHLNLSHRYLLHVFNLLINEISEVARPRSFAELIAGLKGGYRPDEDKLLVEKIEELPNLINSIHQMTEFLSDVPSLYQPNEDDEAIEREPPIERRSLFGFFARRSVVAFRKLSLVGLSQLLQDFQTWSKADMPTASSSRPIKRDAMRDDDQLIKTSHDYHPLADPESFEMFERARANGDKQVASESLRRFFEQRFSDSTDSVLRQHAMLNLIRTHIFNGQIAAARKLLLEAITVARTSGDNVVLQQCMALLRRIEGKSRTQREPLNELQPDIPAMEVLNDVGKLIREGVPLSDSFERLAQALAVYDVSGEFRTLAPLEEQWAFHAMQSVLWRLAGCERLAIIEENIVLAFTEAGGSDDSRFTMLQNRASALARQGREKEALSVLLHPNTWRGLDVSMTQFAYWSGEIWVTMLLYASRRSQLRQCVDFLMPRRPGSFSAYKDFFLLKLDRANAAPGIEGQLYRTLQLRFANQGWSATDHILKAIWQSEYQGRYRLYRLAAVLLADAGLEFGMTLWSRKLVEEVLPQIINGDDLELRAFACYVLARCIIACSKESTDGLKDALPYLSIAEDDYRTLQIQLCLQDVLYVTALVHNQLGDTNARDAAAARHRETAANLERLESIGLNDDWAELWDVVKEIGAGLASRGRTNT